MARVVVIGDVGGHPEQLRRGLAAVGAVDDRQRLPEDVHVVQVGDLVDRGPDSAGVLALVNRYLDEQPDQWIQLLGNHESQYLPRGTAFWPERLESADIALVRSWWERRVLNVAAAVRTAAGEDYLLTHAGLTAPAWAELGAPATAADAARQLNERPDWLIWRGLFQPAENPGPLWAEAGWDVYEPWMRFHAGGSFVPFGQIHGHSTIVSFKDRRWYCSGRVRHRASVDWADRHTSVRIGGRLFIGVDPKHGRGGAPHWRPLVLHGATVISDPVISLRP